LLLDAGFQSLGYLWLFVDRIQVGLNSDTIARAIVTGEGQSKTDVSDVNRERPALRTSE
jgi:hypothetical protein